MSNLQGGKERLPEEDAGGFAPLRDDVAWVIITSKLCSPPQPNGFIHQKDVLCIQTTQKQSHSGKKKKNFFLASRCGVTMLIITASGGGGEGGDGRIMI